ncbi:hypothetical protein IMCC3317_06400 [Kordia antarctica]|uniref:Sigma-54 factor interaction domain-containing protein n=1 Tax=Kordia antarctica TaxID=1218801 RepID=A0A7L4ZH98_9FLAO|nr:sigma 54-interacting transcriptional regulator [Kordia antarctica]QHI35294.1 hypothetical protein IMCC3317_06400 [Kordia antarctica]
MDKMNDLFKTEIGKRREAVQKLNSFITNPGRFSILFLGSRGTGKAHWLKELQEFYKKEADLNLQKSVFIGAANSNKNGENDWIKIFEKVNHGLLVITDVEELTKESQALLFKGISSGQGGKFGFDKKEYDIRIAFTSTKSVSSLRDSEVYLAHKFFDRICQFAVELPSYKDYNRSIWKDFKKTWNKMSFEKENNLPEGKLREWLENQGHSFYGNFRDLDKIAVNWHNYRLQGNSEEKILDLLRKDFDRFYKFPEHSDNFIKEFQISEDSNWKANLNDFKLFYKQYISEKYGSLRKGETETAISYRTMERW